MTTREVPASIGQRVLWQMDHHRGAHGALNCPLLLRLEGRLDVAVLQTAIDGVARRHESLRTTFSGRGPRLRQLIHVTPLPLAIAEVGCELEDDPGAAAQRAIAAEVQTRIDIGERPVRVTLLRLSAESHLLCVNMHHLVTDGWSSAVVADELGGLYEHVLRGTPGLGAGHWQYREWAAWHRAQLDGEHLRRLQRYWRGRLQDARMPALPRHDSTLALAERRTAVLHATLPAAAVAALRSLARTRSTALFTVMLAVYYALLQRETGECDLTVSSIFANRARREAQATVGFLSNMVVLRSRVAPRASFAELIAAADAAVIGAFAHQELPFQMLPLDTIAADSQRPDAIVFQLFAGPMTRTVRAGVVFEPVIDVPIGIGSRWEFELSLLPAGDEMRVLLCFAEDLYDAGWARQFLSSYVALAGALAADPNAPLVRPSGVQSATAIESAPA